MPKLGLTMTEGKVVEWRKKEGDQVAKGEILFVLETEKITYEVESPEGGVLSKILVKEGETAPVGAVVAYIGAAGEKVAAPVAMPKVGGKVEEVVAPGLATTMAPAVEGEKVKASPVAKKLAEEHGIDLAAITGTGPGGRITKEDVEKVIAEGIKAPAVAAAKPEAKPAAEPVAKAKEDQLQKVSTLRKTIARRMTQSFQTTPHFYLTMEVDTKNLQEARQALLPVVEKACQERLTITDMLVKIVAKALEENPDVNSSWTDEGIILRANVNVGIATSIEGGLVVPVIHQANEKSLAEIARLRSEKVTRAREGKMTFDDMTGGTFTITNMGMFGIDAFNAIINPPEAAILAISRIIEKPVAVNGEIKIRPMMSMCLSIDHRVLDGASGGRFLQRVKDLIENPVLMLA